MQKTLKQLIKEVRAICDAHGQIKSFYYGYTLNQIQTSKIDYTAVLMDVSRTGQNRNSTDITIDLLVLDRVKDGDNNNRLDSENITLTIIRDIINTIGYSTRWRLFSDLLSQAPTQKVIDHLQDKAVGYSVSITLQVYNKDGVCDLPMFDYDFDQPITEEDCDVLAIVENTEGTQLITKIVSDSDNTIIVPDIQFTDSDGTTTSVASGKDLVCTPITPCPKDLFTYLNYIDTNDIIEVLGDSNNAGTYTTIDSGLEVSTDGVNYTPLTAPYTIVSATQYYFKRTTATVTETKTLQGNYV